ncbi:MAG: outer membrane beta-barrel protein [Desulfobaccales bacterium]
MGTKTWGLAGLVIIMSMGMVNMAGAADWSIVPSVTQRSEFNSNLNLSPTNVLSDYIFSLSPAADFNYTTEISQLQGHLGLLGQHYISHDNLDHIDQNYQINGRYQIHPKLNLSLNTTYINDSTLLQELQTSGLVIGRTPRQSFYAGPGVTFNITERLLATASYNFNRVLYQSSQFTDYTSHQAGLNFTYLLKNEKTSLISNNTVSETLYPGDNNYKSIGIYGGVAHKFSERWDVNLMSGANINFYSFNTQVVDASQFPFFVQVQTKRLNSSGVSPYVNLSTSYRWTNLTVTGGGSMTQQPSAYGAVYQVNRLYAAINYNITEKLSASLSGGYSLSNQSSQDISSEWNYYTVTPSLNYRITERFSVSPGYSFANSASLTITGSSAHNHIAWIQFSYTYPIHYQK